MKAPYLILVFLIGPVASADYHCHDLLAYSLGADLENPLYDPRRREEDREDQRPSVYDERSIPTEYPGGAYPAGPKNPDRGVSIIDYDDDTPLESNVIYW
ncbi:MAG: hypothetical protein H6626_01995 [Pseudobdellovibrionaceae bacterium]|nr:MAG: hypothetical protein H6626_01995 [Pseudobdellovibrionaceae bacterium]